MKRLKNNQSAQGAKKQMCGLCGSMHVPGEAHHTMKASQFNLAKGMPGVKRIGGGYGYGASRNYQHDQITDRKQSLAGSNNTRSISQSHHMAHNSLSKSGNRPLVMANRLKAQS